MPEDSVTHWIVAARQGNADAIERLWQRYFRRLMVQARVRMSNVSAGSYDEEDAALSTFNVLCRRLEHGGYPELNGRQELWNLLLTVLIRRIGRRVKYQSAAKRPSNSAPLSPECLDEIASPNQEQFSCECQELISSLNDVHLQQVALMRFEGYTNDEIALKLNRTRRTVQRMLTTIRSQWEEELKPDVP